MDTGMLWFDDDKNKPLDQKINQAADYFARKYGRRPDTCLVNSRDLAGDAPKCSGIKLGALDTVQPHHLWIGREK